MKLAKKLSRHPLLYLALCSLGGILVLVSALAGVYAFVSMLDYLTNSFGFELSFLLVLALVGGGIGLLKGMDNLEIAARERERRL